MKSGDQLKTLNIKKKKSIFKNVGTPKGTTFPYDPPSLRERLKENRRFSLEPLVPLRIHTGALI